MGANQSGGQEQQQQQQQTSGDDHQTGGILVVNPTPGQKQSETIIVLPRRVPPVLSIEGHVIDPTRHKPQLEQLNDQLWVDFVGSLHEFGQSRMELVSSRQNQLQDKIVRIDEHVQKFTDSYVNDKHKALARMNDDCRQVDEIERTLQKCTIQGELCLSMLNKLNLILPEELRLEPLKDSDWQTSKEMPDD